MNIRRYLIPTLFLIPTMLLVIAIFLHKPNSGGVLITANQLRQTQAVWTNQTYTPISTNAQFIDKLHDLPKLEGGVHLSVIELTSIDNAISNLVFANYFGDYDNYRRFRTPLEGYEVSYADENTRKGWDAYFHALFPNRPVPNSFGEIDRQIWDQVFGGQHYWLAIGLDKSSISFSVTNQIPNTFGIDVLDPSSTHCMESLTPGTYSYHKVLEETLRKHGKLLVANINFMVDTIDPPKTPRPVLYVMIYYPEAGIWLPIEFAQCSTSGSKYPPPF